MKKQILSILSLVLVVLLSFSLVSCKKEKSSYGDNNFYVYFVAVDSTDLYPVVTEVQEMESHSMLISTIWDILANSSEGNVYQSPVVKGIELKSCELQDFNLVFNFSSTYNDLSPEKELLFRACLTKTFSQLNFVNTVEVLVESQPFTLADGTVVGPQKWSSYFDLIGSGLNVYEKETLTLYFATDDGLKMISEKTTITHNKIFPTEYYVVAKLISGPTTDGLLPVFSSDAKLLSVKTQNGVCHVDLNTGFVEGVENVSPEVQIYAIVNSLTELQDITSVQFTVAGDSNNKFLDSVDLSTPLKRNNDLILIQTVEGTSSAE